MIVTPTARLKGAGDRLRLTVRSREAAAVPRHVDCAIEPTTLSPLKFMRNLPLHGCEDGGADALTRIVTSDESV